jgi:hypothetical protein
MEGTLKWYDWLWLVPLCFIAALLDVVIEIVYDIGSLFTKGYRSLRGGK